MAVDFIAGLNGGIAGLVVVHPMDTIKVRLQMDSSAVPRYRGAFHCFFSIVRQESKMFRTENLIFVVIFTVVQSQDASYLRSSAQGWSHVFLCSKYIDILPDSLFHCDTEYCIFARDACDSVIDCPNFADEDPTICEDTWLNYCNEILNEDNGKPFEGRSCVNGMCITECDVCDGEYLDCADFSDETNCTGHPGPDPDRCELYK